MTLDRYRRKRSAERTPEPFGVVPRRTSTQDGGIFVVQKHSARRLHYDFRLEMEGVLRSWAVPKGPSLNPLDKRLAVAVEDHPLEYGDFEGVIPQGNYGAGAVIVWDRGIYSTLEPAQDAAASIAAGKLDLTLAGFKLRGGFTLVRTHTNAKRTGDHQEQAQWLLIKKRDEYADDRDVTAGHPRSVLSGLTVEEIREAAAAGRQIDSAIVELGVPAAKGKLRPADFPPMLAKLGAAPVEGDRWLFEIKYDGVRALALRDNGNPLLIARSGVDITARYPEVALALRSLPFERFVIDGEIVALNDVGKPNFQLLQKRMHVTDPREIARLSFAVPVCYFAFDLLIFGNHDLRQLPLEQRKHLLALLIRGEGPLRYCDHVVGRGHEFYRAVSEAGLEGMIAKLRASPYRGRRSADWLKIKCPMIGCFAIGGWTDPDGSRPYFGALLLGQYEADGRLRYIDKVGTGFSRDSLRTIHRLLVARPRSDSPFRPTRSGESLVPRGVHFVEPQLVGRVRFGEWTNGGGIRHPSFLGLATDLDSTQCRFEGPHQEPAAAPIAVRPVLEPGAASRRTADSDQGGARPVEVTNPGKIFWPKEGYTKGDLVDYYREVAAWMLPYLADRPVMLTRYPDGIAGKSFYQKDAPAFAPSWLRTERIWSDESQRELAYFVIDSEQALVYIANLAAVTIHVWSSRVPHLERPDWLLFDIDPKGSTTSQAVSVAQAVAAALRELGMRPYLKSSGQMGLHVIVGLKPLYTYEQARMFSELVARLVVARIPQLATINRMPSTRRGKVYIDYLQLGYGKTIAAPYSVRPLSGAPVSAPLRWDELTPDFDPLAFTIKTLPLRAAQMKEDPFRGAIADLFALEPFLPRLQSALEAAGIDTALPDEVSRARPRTDRSSRRRSAKSVP